MDGLQGGGVTPADDGQQDGGARTPCASPHHGQAGRRLGIIQRGGEGLEPAASACPRWPPVRAEDDASPSPDPTELRAFLPRLWEMFHIVRNWLESRSCDESRVLRTEISWSI